MSDRRPGGGRLAVLLAVLAVAAVVYLTSRATPMPPYSIESSKPDGYRALALLARDQGATVREVPPAQLGAGPGVDVLVVPRPSLLSVERRDHLQSMARGGATVVLGERFGAEDPEVRLTDLPMSHRILADTEPMAVQPGRCSIDALAGLGPIDRAFALAVPVLEGEASCYGEGVDALITDRPVGDGRIVTLADPLLWANARLQPAKESGGQPLDNAATALRLTGAAPGVDIGFVPPVGVAGSPAGGTRDPIELLPLPVKLALVQGAAAVVLYLWWRGRRLGRPVSEPLPVEIAASELVVAVGDLLRRRGSAERAARSMREDTRRVLQARLGIPVGTAPEVLVERVAQLTGRPPAEVAAALLDPGRPGGTAVAGVDALVRLAHQLDSIRQEALDDQPVR